jgi:osmotically-inducible protein OsmY
MSNCLRHVHSTLATLLGQPCYSPDDVIAAGVDHALSAVDCLCDAGYDEVNVGVQGGIVTLRGHVLSRVLRDRLEQAARAVPGVLEVNSRLVDDDGLATIVAQALERDARTQRHPFHVSAYRGFVTLRGQVDSLALRSAAEEVVAGVPQARGVINEVIGPGGDTRCGKPPMPPLQPAVGQEIYASDMPLGHVTRVMISRCNRLVTAVVAQGDFPDVRLDQRISIFDDVPLRERRVVIPIGAVRFTTDSATFLAVNGAAASVYHDLVPSDMVYPDPHWEPPIPTALQTSCWHAVAMRTLGLEPGSCYAVCAAVLRRAWRRWAYESSICADEDSTPRR